MTDDQMENAKIHNLMHTSGSIDIVVEGDYKLTAPRSHWEQAIEYFQTNSGAECTLVYEKAKAYFDTHKHDVLAGRAAESVALNWMQDLVIMRAYERVNEND